MFINLEKFVKSGLTAEELILLCYVKQEIPKYLEDNSELFGVVEGKGFISFIKGKPKDSKYVKARLSDKGKKVLISLVTSSVSDEATAIQGFVSKTYKRKNGGIVKNEKELGRRIQWFMDVTGIYRNYLSLLIRCAIMDTYDPDCGETFHEAKKSNPRLILSNMAENLFWTPENHFSKHYTLDTSPLYRYYIDNEEYIKQVWEANLNEDGTQKRK